MGTNLKYAVLRWSRDSVLWRWRAAVLTGRGQDAPAEVWAAMAWHEEALAYEAEELATALDDHAQKMNARRKKILSGVARLIREDQARLRATTLLDPRVFNLPPAGGGGVGGLKGALSALSWAEVGNVFKKIAIGLGVIFGITAGITVSVVAYRTFLRSEEDTALARARAADAILSKKAEALAACADNPDPERCREDVNDLFDSLMPGQCGVLDTPLGSVLGGLVGIGAGYVGMRALMGWT